jgi:hypothetical protein
VCWRGCRGSTAASRRTSTARQVEQQGLAPNVVLRSEDTHSLDLQVREGNGCALLREEVALPGVERGQWMVWGHARVDAQLYFSTAPDRAGDPLVVALGAVVRAAWAA